MSESTNLGLHLTGDSAEDKAKLFGVWRKEVNGEAATSNANIIDAAIGNLNKLDTEDKNSLVDAINEVAENQDGFVSYLDEQTLTDAQKARARANIGAGTGSGGGAVDSVNGKTGTVVLDANDVGAVAEPAEDGTIGQVLTTDGAGGRSWATVEGGVTSVNDQTGAVQLDAGDINVDDTAQEPETIASALSSLNSDKENLSNKVTAIGAGSTDAQYPSAKGVYDELYGGRIWTGTQAEYDAIVIKSSTTLYFIVEETA